jgi:hypothetical protein
MAALEAWFMHASSEFAFEPLNGIRTDIRRLTHMLRRLAYPIDHGRQQIDG